MDALGTNTYELLRDAYQVIDGIPDDRVRLSAWQGGNGEIVSQANCGTIACSVGFIALHPGFRNIGVRTIWNSGMPFFNGKVGHYALAELFGIHEREAEALFGRRHFDAVGFSATLTDRQVWLARVRKFLADKAKPDNMYEAAP